MIAPQEHVEQAARRAGAAVRFRARSAAADLLGPEVLRRRWRRRRAGRVLAAVGLLALLGVPAVHTLLDDTTSIDFADTPPRADVRWERIQNRDEVFGQAGAADAMDGLTVLGDRIVAVGTASANGVGGRVRPGVWLADDARSWRSVSGDRIDDGGLTEAALLMHDVVALDDGKLVAVGYINWEPATAPAVWISEDAGESWTLHRDVDLSDVDNGEMYAVTVAPDGALVAVGQRNGSDFSQSAPTTWRSEDAVTWEMVDAGSSGPGMGRLIGVAASQDRLVAVGSSTEGAALIQHSDDGQAWQVAPPLGRVHLSDVLALGDTFVAVGSTTTQDGRVYVSDDSGWTWREVTGRGERGRAGVQDLLAVGLAEDGQVVVAGSDRNRAAVWVRDNMTWTRVSGDEDLWPPGGVTALATSQRHGLVAVGFTPDAGGSQDAAVWLSPPSTATRPKEAEAGDPGVERETVPLPSWPGPGGEDAEGGGFLTGSRSVDGGCVWLTEDSTPKPPRLAYLWPEGFRARFDPVELIGPDGVVIAREGDYIAMGGGVHTIDAIEINRCTFGVNEVFRVQVGSVRRAEPPGCPPPGDSPGPPPSGPADPTGDGACIADPSNDVLDPIGKEPAPLPGP